MSEKLRIGADDPDMGRSVMDAHEKEAVRAAAPGAAKVGAAVGTALAWVALLAVGCVLLSLIWIAVHLAEAL